jgi:uncharacterized protein (DUF305 family)
MTIRAFSGAFLFLTATLATGCADPGSPVSPSRESTPVDTNQRTTTSTGAAGVGKVTSAPAPTQSAAQYEQKFLIDMIDHHQMAVMTAEMCVDKAIHPELAALCADIISTQSAEISQMQTWLANWYGTNYEPQINPGHMKQMQKLAALSGDEFEIMFMEMMIRHHRTAVQKGGQCIDRAYHQELIDLCHNIVETQTAEIELMESWLCAWYSICR